MGTFQPLYFSGGRYTSGTDRKMIASLIAAESSGVRVTGVIPADINNASMKVSAGGTNQISIAQGLCVIADSNTPTATTGLYIAGIEGAPETATFTTNNTASTRTDTVYAVVDETPYTITKKALASNVATITTSSAHGFKVGQTVTVSGVDDIFDGAYQIVSVPTTTSFTYSRSNASDISETNVTAEVRVGANWAAVTSKAINGTTSVVTLTVSNTSGYYNGTLTTGDIATIKGVDFNIDGSYKISVSGTTITFTLNKTVNTVTQTPASPAVQNSAVAVARVPFAIKIDEGTAGSLSSNTKIRLATYTVAAGGGNTAVVTDLRQFVTTMGGVHLYSSTATAPSGVGGRLHYNTSTNTMEYYTTTWNPILELDATLTSATKAAPANHVHTNYASSTHTHTGYAATSHTHTLAQITDYDPGDFAPTYVFPPDPTSAGTDFGGATVTVSNSSFATFTIGGASTTTTVTADYPFFALVEWSCEAYTSSNSVKLNVAPSFSGGTTISAAASTGTLSNQTNASDGTAYNAGDYATTYSTTFSPIQGSRYVRLSGGSTTITLQARVSSGTATINNPVVRVFPLRFV